MFCEGEGWSVTELSVRRYELAAASAGHTLYFGGGNGGVGGSDPHAGSRLDVFDVDSRTLCIPFIQQVLDVSIVEHYWFLPALNSVGCPVKSLHMHHAWQDYYFFVDIIQSFIGPLTFSVYFIWRHCLISSRPAQSGLIRRDREIRTFGYFHFHACAHYFRP
eukprot:COSAG05_NODE_138_length_16837_cov_344.961286_4_plen_162_part_00